VNKTDTRQRDEEIRKSKEPAPVLAERFGLSKSHVYRVRRNVHNAERFADKGNGRSMVGGGIYSEIGLTGLRRFGGNIDEEYDRVWKPLSKKVALIKEMADDPIIAAVLQAVRMTLKRVKWYVEPGGDSQADGPAAEFLESCMNDMSQSWTDTIDNAINMIRDGFSLCEIVYKKRAGLRKDGISKYDDGRIAWRKWLFIGPDSLAPGEPWMFDEHGGIQGIKQQPPPDYQLREIPIDKMILFRTTSYKNNPEGYPLPRAMYPAWYMKKNLEEIEAISAERIGAGFPVIYMGSDVGKNLDDPNSDAAHLQDAGRNIRVDEQMSLLVPYAKMGAGAREGEGVLFEFVSPPGTKAINFHETITRYEQRMTMVGLAQFIHLGMNQVGARALGESSQDFFTTGLAGWADAIEDTIRRFGTERLFRLNHFPGITDIPRITHEAIGKYTLAELADYISKLAGPGLIVPDTALEQFLRQFAELPEKPIEVQAPEGKQPTDGEIKLPDVSPQLTLNGAQVRAALDVVRQVSAGEISQEAGINALQILFNLTEDQASRLMGSGAALKKAARATGVSATSDNKKGAVALTGDKEAAEKAAERFADLRGVGKAGRRPKAIEAVNAYQKALESEYADWAEDLASQLADADEGDREALLAAALAALLLQLRAEGRKRITDAMMLALDGEPPTPEMLQALTDTIAENDRYLESSLIPAIRRKMEDALTDEDILTAIETGAGDDALLGWLGTMTARTALYAGAWWKLFNHIVGRKASENNREVIWYLDPSAKHCHDCPSWGSPEGTHYESYEKMLEITGGMAPADGVECGGYCRCGLGEGDFVNVSGIPLTET